MSIEEEKFSPEMIDYALNRGVSIKELDQIIIGLYRAAKRAIAGEKTKIEVFNNIGYNMDTRIELKDFIITDNIINIEELFWAVVRELKKEASAIDKHIKAIDLLGAKISHYIIPLIVGEKDD